MDSFPTQEQIATALSSTIPDKAPNSDMLQFLSLNNYQKAIPLRLLAWLIGLKLVPALRSQWVPSIVRLLTHYNGCLERYCDSCKLTPFDALPGPAGSLIRETLQSSLTWFHRFSGSLGLIPPQLQDAEFRIERLFVILSHDAQNFEYQDGFQFVGAVCYLVATVMAVKSGLDHSFAEGLAFHLTREFIAISTTENREPEIENLVQEFSPQAKVELRKANLDLSEFTREWERKFFVEQHNPYNLMLIWDFLVFHAAESRRFVSLLCVAHLKQMVQAKVDFRSDEGIKEMQWRAMKIIEDVEGMMKRKEGGSKMKWMLKLVCPCWSFFQKK
jgi:hypothetical protein